MKLLTYSLSTLLLTLSSMATTQENSAPDQKLPLDPNITVGRLENGLTYYIRENHKPEARAELRLVVNAGSVLENDDQQGLAHFVEHMAFNGTENFAKHEIIDYLESIGMRFGPDINARTSFDETVYMLQVPTDDAEIVETGFQILQEWASHVSFEEAEIDKERGVVVEEWRLGRGAGARMRDKQFPILFKDSRYAQRLPIGKKEILESAPYDALLQFYRDWYRPDLMAVVAVGDFDKAWIQSLIEERFSTIPAVQDSRQREMFPVPNHKETLFALASDVEATRTSVAIYYKNDVQDESTAGAYRQMLVENIYNGMLNNRLNELLQQPEPPFLAAFSTQGRFIRTKEFYVLSAFVKENGLQAGLEAMLTEALRVKRHGFTRTELEREKTEMLRGIEQAYNERDKTESSRYAAEYIRNFLQEEPLPGIEAEFQLYKQFLPGITLDEVNELANKWIRDDNRVVTVSTPEKEETPLPSEQSLLTVFEKVNGLAIEPYVDAVTNQPLVANPPTPGTIIREKTIPELGVTEWQLSNGVRVVLKPTDFKNDELLFDSFSPGGHSLVSDENYISAIAATAIIGEAGLGNFDQIALQKKLAGKIVSVSPSIGELQESISGSASPQDLETMFELIYLYFTAPRKDSTAYLSFQARMNGFIENRHASPEQAYRDTIQVTMSRHHYRTRPWSKKVLAEMDLEKSFRIYQDRFADASDFTFLFVGSFELETMKPLVAKYLGGLPAVNRKEAWRDMGIDAPKGIVERKVKKGLEPKSQVRLIFTGPFKWNRENRHRLFSMTSVLQIKLREILREDLSGTYGVGVWPSVSRHPDEEYSINIAFGCAPERVEELTQTVFDQIDSLKTHGTRSKYLKKVKKKQTRKRQTDLKKNGFWLRSLRAAYYHGGDPKTILQFDELVDSLTLKDIRKTAEKYFNTRNYVKVVLLPEES
ncbi:MAG: M16 family metallopeptidase [bacterium]